MVVGKKQKNTGIALEKRVLDMR